VLPYIGEMKIMIKISSEFLQLGNFLGIKNVNENSSSIFIIFDSFKEEQ